MNWWENPNNTDQEAVTLQQQAYIKFLNECPEVLAHLWVISESMSTEGMTASERVIAGRARDVLLASIRKNAGVVDGLTLVKAFAEIAMKSPITVKEPEKILPGYNRED